eukprot:TRINITY_DN8930_c0_g1_i1.p1 TRINITY_DN8930_c0_g1~~TRINITY_DN8930_c0_g1_i1.p1  ORF type:complete len:456 (+),score=109.87 TRINITY_DN8930_c0_g1_i1:282-1649(+)
MKKTSEVRGLLKVSFMGPRRSLPSLLRCKSFPFAICLQLSPKQRVKKDFFFVTWRRSSTTSKSGTSGRTNTYKYKKGDNDLKIEENFEFSCALFREKKGGKMKKKYIIFHIKEVVDGKEKDHLRINADLGQFFNSNPAKRLFNLKKSESYPFLKLEFSSCEKERNNKGEYEGEEDLTSLSSVSLSEFTSRTDDDEDKDNDVFLEEVIQEASEEEKKRREQETRDKVEKLPSMLSVKEKELREHISNRSPDINLKVIVVGDSGVGKTNILNRYNGLNFDQSSIATIGVSLWNKQYLAKNDKVVHVGVWDTAGQERFRAITKTYYRGTNGVVLVYDITKMKSFTSLADYWMKEIVESNNESSKLQVILVGNKADLEKDRQVPKSRGEQLAKEMKAAFLETSAMTNSNIFVAFETLILEILANHPGMKTQTAQTVEVSGSSSQVLVNTTTPPPSSSCC